MRADEALAWIQRIESAGEEPSIHQLLAGHPSLPHVRKAYLKIVHVLHTDHLPVHLYERATNAFQILNAAMTAHAGDRSSGLA